jgi:uncharacterized surface protein with fasciclin (FAS1) repeats
MIKRFAAIVAALSLSAFVAVPALAHQDSMGSMSGMKDPMVGGAAMSPAKNIIQNAVNSKDHTTLVSLVKKAGLVETLEGPGPFTVFAPTNEAFAKIPKATLEAVGNDPATLKKILTYHVVAGKMDSKAIAEAIKAGGGKATLKTVEGEDITADMEDGKLVLTDAKGGKSIVTIPDVYQSNGVIHVINTVLMP